MSVKIANGQNIFKGCLQVLPAVLQPALLCMQFAWFPQAILQTALQFWQMHFIIVLPEFFFVLFPTDSCVISCNRHMQTVMLHYLNWLIAAFVSALKCIKNLIAFCEKGLAIACKIQKIQKEKSRIPSYSLKRVADCL